MGHRILRRLAGFWRWLVSSKRLRIFFRRLLRVLSVAEHLALLILCSCGDLHCVSRSTQDRCPIGDYVACIRKRGPEQGDFD